MSTENELRELLDINERRLHQLKKQEASFGPHTPAHISIEIDELVTEINKLRQQLGLPKLVVESPPEQTPAPSRSETPQQPQPEIRPSSQESVPKKSGGKWWILIVVILVGLAGYVYFSMWNPSPEPELGEFPYRIRVISPVGEPLPDAHIVMQPAERDQLEQWTNGEGLVEFFLDGSLEGVPAIVFVRKEGFHEREQEIMLHPEGYDEIPLEPIEP